MHGGIVSYVPLGSRKRLVQEPHWILAAKSSKEHRVCPAQGRVVRWELLIYAIVWCCCQ